MICFVIENDRRGLRNEGTAHFGCHGWNMISAKLVFDLIYEFASVRYDGALLTRISVTRLVELDFF